MRVLLIAALCLVATGCVQRTWAPGPTASGKDFGSTSGQCKLVSIGAVSGGGGFVAASGSPQFVAAYSAAALIGSAIGSAIRQQQTYDACLEANGFVVVADKPPT